MKFIFGQGVTRGPAGNVTISLPGGFEPDSTVMVVLPVRDRSRPPTPDEFKEVMLGEEDNFEKGILDKDRIDAIRVLDINTNTVPNTGRIDVEPVRQRREALVVELRTSLTAGEARFIDERMRRELSSTFFIDTFARVV